MIELTEIMRQKDDQQFVELLNRFRTASQTDSDINCSNSHSISPSADTYPSGALHIWAENDPVNEHNNNQLEQLTTPLFILKATDVYPQNITKQQIDKFYLKGRSETGGLDFEVTVKVGVRVMLTNNIDIADRLINGQMGTVLKIGVNEITQKPSIVYLKFDDTKAGQNLTRTSGNNFAKENALVPVQPVLTKIKLHPGKASSPEVQRIQFPISLAWACTVHKVQGLTLQNVVISFNLNRQRSFNYGQVYVALSRATSLSGLHINGKINSKHVRADPRVTSEYERLRSLSNLQDANKQLGNVTSVITLCLLNIRSLRKHAADVRSDSNLFTSHILAFTETQLSPKDSDTDIRDTLSPFILYRHDHHSDKFSSMAICRKQEICLSNHEYFPALNGVKFTFSSENNIHPILNLSLLLLYRKNNTNVRQFVDGLKYLLTTEQIDIVLGDLNINYFSTKDIAPLAQLMESLNYVQIVDKATFISGTLLDHVWVQHGVKSSISASVISVYYSDHDAIRINIQLP